MDQENFDDMPALSPQNLDDMEIWTPRVNKKIVSLYIYA